MSNTNLHQQLITPGADNLEVVQQMNKVTIATPSGFNLSQHTCVTEFNNYHPLFAEYKMH